VSIADDVRAFIVAELGWTGSASELTDDYPLIEREVIDSLGIFKLVTFIEEHYGVEIDDEEMVPDNFETIADVAELVGAKTGAG
jgi:acyl carrier protein